MAARAATPATPPIASRQRGSGRLFALIRLASAHRAGTHSNAPFARQSQSFLRESQSFLAVFEAVPVLTREKGQPFDSGWLHHPLLGNHRICTSLKTRRHSGEHVGEGRAASRRVASR